LDYLVICQHQIEYLGTQVNRFSFVLREYSSIGGWVLGDFLFRNPGDFAHSALKNPSLALIKAKSGY